MYYENIFLFFNLITVVTDHIDATLLSIALKYSLLFLEAIADAHLTNLKSRIMIVTKKKA